MGGEKCCTHPLRLWGRRLSLWGAGHVWGGGRRGVRHLEGCMYFKGGVGRAATLVGGAAPRVEAEAISAAHTHSGCKFAQ